MNKYVPDWQSLVRAARDRHMSAYRLGEIGRGILAHEDELQRQRAEVERLRTEINNVISALKDEDQHSQALAAVLQDVVNGSTHADT